jgi:DNA-binding MarR family transcriptional regulator
VIFGVNVKGVVFTVQKACGAGRASGPVIRHVDPLSFQTLAHGHPIPTTAGVEIYLHVSTFISAATHLDGGRMARMERHATGVVRARDRGPLSPCVCSSLRMVSRAVTQLYDDILRPCGLRVTQFSILATIARRADANLRQLERALAIDQTTLTRSVNLLERDRMIERVPNPDGRVKAMRLTGKGRRVLDVARPLWTQAQGRVLRELGRPAWADVQRRLARLLDVAVVKRRLHRDRSRKLNGGRS